MSVCVCVCVCVCLRVSGALQLVEKEPHKEINVSIPRIREYVILHSKEDFTDVIKKILDYLWGRNIIASFLIRKEERLDGQRRGYSD